QAHPGDERREDEGRGPADHRGGEGRPGRERAQGAVRDEERVGRARGVSCRKQADEEDGGAVEDEGGGHASALEASVGENVAREAREKERCVRQGALVEVEVGRVVRAPRKGGRRRADERERARDAQEELAEILAAHRPAGCRDARGESASATRRTRSVSCGSFTTAGLIFRYTVLASHPSDRAACSATSRTRDGRRSATSASKDRHVPRSVTDAGRMLNAEPPCIDVTETTAGKSGESRRATIVWSAVTT